MTEQEFESFASRVDDIADAVKAKIDLSSFTLSKQEKALLSALPPDVIEAIEKERAKINIGNINVRDAIANKAIAQMMLHMKDYIASAKLGYEMGGLT
jgi:hypothetical protein